MTSYVPDASHVLQTYYGRLEKRSFQVIANEIPHEFHGYPRIIADTWWDLCRRMKNCSWRLLHWHLYWFLGIIFRIYRRLYCLYRRRDSGGRGRREERKVMKKFFLNQILEKEEFAMLHRIHTLFAYNTFWTGFTNAN